MRIIICIFIVLLTAVSCAVPEKTQNGAVNKNSRDFFPLQDGCGWVYLVGENKVQYQVRVLAADKDSGMIAWGNKTFAYVHKNDGVYNSTENYYIIKNGVQKWNVVKGKAEYIELKDKIVLKSGSYKAFAVKETYPDKKFYTMSYYGYMTGLIKFEVFSLDDGKLIEKMELDSYLCSDPD